MSNLAVARVWSSYRIDGVGQYRSAYSHHTAQAVFVVIQGLSVLFALGTLLFGGADRGLFMTDYTSQICVPPQKNVCFHISWCYSLVSCNLFVLRNTWQGLGCTLRKCSGRRWRVNRAESPFYLFTPLFGSKAGSVLPWSQWPGYLGRPTSN